LSGKGSLSSKDFYFYFYFFVVNFHHFVKNIFGTRIVCHKCPVFWGKFFQEKQKNRQKITTTSYSMKGCLRFFYLHIFNIAKFG